MSVWYLSRCAWRSVGCLDKHARQVLDHMSIHPVALSLSPWRQKQATSISVTRRSVGWQGIPGVVRGLARYGSDTVGQTDANIADSRVVSVVKSLCGGDEVHKVGLYNNNNVQSRWRVALRYGIGRISNELSNSFGNSSRLRHQAAHIGLGKAMRSPLTGCTGAKCQLVRCKCGHAPAVVPSTSRMTTTCVRCPVTRNIPPAKSKPERSYM